MTDVPSPSEPLEPLENPARLEMLEHFIAALRLRQGIQPAFSFRRVVRPATGDHWWEASLRDNPRMIGRGVSQLNALRDLAQQLGIRQVGLHDPFAFPCD